MTNKLKNILNHLLLLFLLRRDTNIYKTVKLKKNNRKIKPGDIIFKEDLIK